MSEASGDRVTAAICYGAGITLGLGFGGIIHNVPAGIALGVAAGIAFRAGDRTWAAQVRQHPDWREDDPDSSRGLPTWFGDI